MTTFNRPPQTLESYFDKFDYLMTAYDHSNRKEKFLEMKEAAKEISEIREYVYFEEDGFKFTLTIRANSNSIGMLSVQLNGLGDIDATLNSGDAKTTLYANQTSGGLLELMFTGNKNPFDLDNRLIANDVIPYLVLKLMTYINNNLSRR